MGDQVECRSDHAYIGYPMAFYWKGMRLKVDEVMSEKQDPTGYSFLVRNHQQGIFRLDYDINADQWSVEQS